MELNIPKDKYKKRADDAVEKSDIWIDMLKAFVVGGIICTIGQVISFGAQNIGFTKEQAGTVTSIVLILMSAVATGFGWYDNLGRWAGAGSILPITGFANSITSPAMEYKSEGLITGLGVKMFIVAGPVLVYGISASVIAGILTYLISLV
ncbi:MAG: SpoVA/SpoVAEb family sporulation membrane protein [Clostridia bacterium]|nr:SpoVA/SpoVAEb family sporulation membrane protein [Clostridia bacterium]